MIILNKKATKIDINKKILRIKKVLKKGKKYIGLLKKEHATKWQKKRSPQKTYRANSWGKKITLREVNRKMAVSKSVNGGESVEKWREMKGWMAANEQLKTVAKCFAFYLLDCVFLDGAIFLISFRGNCVTIHRLSCFFFFCCFCF